MSDPHHKLDLGDKERVVKALRIWAERQSDLSEPVLRFLDGSAVAPQDLLDQEPPSDLWSEPVGGEFDEGLVATREPDPGGRAWRHLVNLVAVSVNEGEDLDQLLADLTVPREHGEPA